MNEALKALEKVKAIQLEITIKKCGDKGILSQGIAIGTDETIKAKNKLMESLSALESSAKKAVERCQFHVKIWEYLVEMDEIAEWKAIQENFVNSVNLSVKEGVLEETQSQLHVSTEVSLSILFF